jgi:transcriptional regulator with XRE-family HTH domain
VPSTRKGITPVEAAIGKRLRELRDTHGLTQADLAKRLGIPQSVVSDYERGIVRVHGQALIGLAKALKTTTDEILGLKESNGHRVMQDRRFLRRLSKIDRLPRRDKQTLLGTIDALVKSAGIE